MITRTRSTPLIAGEKPLRGKKCGERILRAMELGVWYAPKDIVELTGVKKAAVYMSRLHAKGLVRRKAQSVVSERNFIYRKVDC